MKGLPPLEEAGMSVLLSLLIIRFILHIHLSPVFFFFALYFPFLQVSLRSAFQIKAKTDLSLDLSFLDKTTPAPQSLVHPSSDSDVDATHYTMSHLLGLDLLSLSTSKNDAFYATLAVLTSASKVPRSKVFILEALAQTSSVFPKAGKRDKSTHFRSRVKMG